MGDPARDDLGDGTQHPAYLLNAADYQAGAELEGSLRCLHLSAAFRPDTNVAGYKDQKCGRRAGPESYIRSLHCISKRIALRTRRMTG